MNMLGVRETCYLYQITVTYKNCALIHHPLNNLTDVEILSAHGDLEHVTLLVNSITIKGITTLINSSPNLTLLLISTKQSVFGEVDASSFYNEYTSRIAKEDVTISQAV